MTWFRNMKMRSKLILAFLIVSLLGTVLGVTGFVSARIFATKANELLVYSGQVNSFASILNAHYSWRNALTEAVLTGSEFTGSLDPRACILGQWMNSDEAKSVTDPRIVSLLARATAPHDYIHYEAAKVLNHLRSGDRDAATRELMNNIIPKFYEVITPLLEINARYAELVEEKEKEASQVAATTTTVIVVLIIVVLTASVFLALLISGIISKPIAALTNFFNKAGTTGDISASAEERETFKRNMSTKDEIGQLTKDCAAFLALIWEVRTALKAIAEGNLTHEVKLASDKDTMGLALQHLFESFNKMFGEIHASASRISNGANLVAETATNIADGSEQIASGAQSLTEGATEQAASVAKVSSAIAEIAEKTKANANMTDQAAKLADTIINKAGKGSRQMEEMITAVNDVTDASKSVSVIMKTINGIAEQTNLLALNAAIEAARAGEQGRGFAVVAEEVRKLAAQSEEAVKETSSIINTSMEKAELGARVAKEMAASLTEIVAGINESSRLIMEIAKASEEQSTNVSQINTSIDQVAEVVQRNSALAEESAASSEESAAASQESAAAANEMRNQVAILQDLISQFKLKEESAAPLGLPPSKQLKATRK